MAALYQLTSSNLVLRTSDNTLVPPHPFDLSRKAYLEWLKAGNKPDPAVAEVPSLAQAQAAAVLAIDNAHTNNIQMLQGNPTQTEKDSWDAKLLWAQASIAAPTALATGAAAAYFLTLGLSTAAQQLAWAEGVMLKALFVATVRGLADSIRSTAKAAVAAALTPADVQAALDTAKAQAAAAVAQVTSQMTAQVTPQPAVAGNITGNSTVSGNTTASGNVTA